MTSPELARILDGQRDELNRIFRQQALLSPQARADDFLRTFGILAEAATSSLGRDAHLREAGGPVVRSLFIVSLELLGRGLLGQGGRGLEPSLGRLIEAFPGPLAQDPDRFLRSAANAMAAVGEGSEGSLEKWLGLMTKVGGAVVELEAFLKTGLAAAWLAGLAQYRRAAVKMLPELSSSILAGLFGIDTPGPSFDAEKFSKAVADDPWIDPIRAATGQDSEQACLATAGGWRGYGGPFEAPPTVAVDDQGVLAYDGQACYRVFADRWGTFLLPEPDTDINYLKIATVPGFSLSETSLTVGGGQWPRQGITPLSRAGLPWAGAGLPASAAALLGNTLYFTHPLSYLVFVVGLPGGTQDSNRTN